METGAPLIKLVVLDWAGTVIDYGSLAPVAMFTTVFERRGIDITEAEVRAFMGMGKKEHLVKLLGVERIADVWWKLNGAGPKESDVISLYNEMLEQQADILVRYCEPIPGALIALEALRGQGTLIGSTTGYGREAMTVVAPVAAQRGFKPDNIVCVSDVPAGRPAPWMAQLSAQRLGVYPPWRCVKVDDTEAGVREGRNASMWAVGVVLTGNEIGLSQEAVASLPREELAARTAAARVRLQAAGAHYTVDSIAALPGVVDEINAKLAMGMRPDCAHVTRN